MLLSDLSLRWRRDLITYIAATFVVSSLIQAKDCQIVAQPDLAKYVPSFPKHLKRYSTDGTGDFYSWSGRQGWEISYFDKSQMYGGKWSKGLQVKQNGLDGQGQNLFRVIDKNGVAHDWYWLNQNDECYYGEFALVDVADVHVFGIVPVP